MGNDVQFPIQITGDASSLVAASQQTGKALGQVGEKQEEAGKQAEKHGAHLHELHRVFHSLNEIVPGLGVLMQAAFSPVGAAISLAVIAFRLFHEKVRETNEEFQKLEEEAAKPATLRMVALREATVETAVGLGHLKLALADAARGEQTVKETTERTMAVFKELARDAATLAEAMNQNDLASLDQRHAAGLVLEEQYAAQRLAIEEHYQAEKRQLEENAAMVEILVKKRALEQAVGAQPGLISAAELAELKKVGALENLGSLDKSGVEERKKETAAKLKEFENGLTGGWWGNLKGADRDKQLEGFEALGPGKTKGDADQWFRSHASR